MSLTAVQQSEIVERVARALHDVVAEMAADQWSDPDVRERYFQFASVVLDEMRDPTEAMIQAAILVHYGYDISDDDKRDGARNIWRAMIDVARCP